MGSVGKIVCHKSQEGTLYSLDLHGNPNWHSFSFVIELLHIACSGIFHLAQWEDLVSIYIFTEENTIGWLTRLVAWISTLAHQRFRKQQSTDDSSQLCAGVTPCQVYHWNLINLSHTSHCCPVQTPVTLSLCHHSRTHLR